MYSRYSLYGFDPERCLEAIERYQPDSLILLPQMLHALVARLARGRTGDARIRSLKFVPVGGAKTPAPLITRARDLGLPVYEGYGLTEASPVVCCAALRVPSKPMSIGMPLPATDVRFLDIETNEVAKLGERGELQVKGPQVMLGYYENAEASADAFLDGDGRVPSSVPVWWITFTCAEGKPQAR